MRSSKFRLNDSAAVPCGAGPARALRKQHNSRPMTLPTLGLVVALALAFAIYAIAWRDAPELTSDSPGYMRLANDIAHLRITELHQRTPGYPLLLLLAGAERKPTRGLFYLSLAIHLATVASYAYLLRKVEVRRLWIAVFALISLLPPFVEPAAYVMTETLTQFALTLTYLFLLLWLVGGRTRESVLFGIAALFCALVRPTYQALTIFLIPCLAAYRVLGLVPALPWRRMFLPLATATALCLGTLTALAWFNLARFGYFGTTSLGPYQLATKTVSFIEFLPDRYAGLRSILIKHRDRFMVEHFDDHTGQNYIYRAFPDVKHYYNGDEIKSLEALQQANLYLILHKPLSYLSECLKAFGTYWMPNEVPFSSGRSSALKALWALVQMAVVGMFFVQAVAVGGLIVFFAPASAVRHQLPKWLAIQDGSVSAYVVGLAIVTYTMVLSCFAGIGAARYRIPTDLMIVANTIIGLTIWKRVITSMTSRQPD